MADRSASFGDSEANLLMLAFRQGIEVRMACQAGEQRGQGTRRQVDMEEWYSSPSGSTSGSDDEGLELPGSCLGASEMYSSTNWRGYKVERKGKGEMLSRCSNRAEDKRMEEKEEKLHGSCSDSAEEERKEGEKLYGSYSDSDEEEEKEEKLRGSYSDSDEEKEKLHESYSDSDEGGEKLHGSYSDKLAAELADELADGSSTCGSCDFCPMARTKRTAVQKNGQEVTAEGATAVRAKPTKVSAPPASRAKPTKVSAPPASRAKPTKVSAPPASRAKPTKVSAPPASRAKPTKVSAPPASRAKPKQSAKQLKAQKTQQAKAAPKAGGTSGTRSVPASGSGATFVVSSMFGYPPDGWHSYCPPDMKHHGVFATAAEAQDHAHEIFYKKNPWGLEEEEIEEKMETGYKSMGPMGGDYEVGTEDGEWWKVEICMDSMMPNSVQHGHGNGDEEGEDDDEAEGSANRIASTDTVRAGLAHRSSRALLGTDAVCDSSLGRPSRLADPNTCDSFLFCCDGRAYPVVCAGCDPVSDSDGGRDPRSPASDVGPT
eukprot:gene29051-32253_t